MPASRTTSARASCSASDASARARRFLTLLLLAAASACTKGQRPIINVDVVDRSGRALDKPAVALLDADALEAAAVHAASDYRGFEMRKARAGEVGWQLTVEVAMMLERPAIAEEGQAAPEGQVHRAAAVALTLAALAPTDKGAMRFEGDGVSARNVPTSTPFQTLVLEAIEDASRSLSASIRLAEAGNPEILRALSSDDRGLKRRAIVMAGERGMKDAVPRLSEMVRDASEDQDSVLKAIGALVAIGDDRAVGALIDAGRQRPSAYLAQILFAVGALGGKEAEAYLFTVSNGHADPEVRKNASDALTELERRKSARDEQRSPNGGEGDKARKPE